MPRGPLVLAVAFLAAALLPSPSGAQEKAPAVPLVRVKVPAEPFTPGPALRYGLLPPARDVVQGNAAPRWVRAALAAVEQTRDVTPEQWAWATADMPLQELPRDKVRALLRRCGTALRLAEEAARCDRCDWDFPPPSIQSLDLPLTEVQHLRRLAQLLSLRCRLEMSEGHFAPAARTLQTGLALARHVGDGPLLLQSIVGVAVATIMVGRLEEWVGLPGAPSLYWPLTALPDPLVSCDRAIRTESASLYRSFPRLRSLAGEKLTRDQAEGLASELLRTLAPLADDRVPPDWQARLAMAAIALKVYPEAKRYLAEHGRTPEEVEAMPILQAVLVFHTEQYDTIWDEVLKLLNLPYWQAQPGLDAADRQVKEARREDTNLFVGLLMPAVLRVRQSDVRLRRQVAGLRCAEAVRLHAAGHGGRLPQRLEEIATVPLPVDPITGKGFDAFYRATEGGAMLAVPAPPGQPPSSGRRYEFTPAR
jgi:hypothetical protein